MERNDLEQLFVECIEEVRKEIMRRRLKNEIYTRKKFHQVDQTVQEAKDFWLSEEGARLTVLVEGGLVESPRISTLS